MYRKLLVILFLTCFASGVYAARTFSGDEGLRNYPFYDLNEPPISMVGWVYRESSVDSATWFSLADSASGENYIFVSLDGSNKIRFGVRNADTSIYKTSSEAASLETWHQVAASWDANDAVRIWVDGVGGYAGTIAIRPSGVNRVCIGFLGDLSPSYAFDGSVADVVLWDAELAQATVTDLYDNMKSGELYGNPVSSWRLDESTGDANAVDTMGNYDLGVYLGSPDPCTVPFNLTYSESGVTAAIYYIDTDDTTAPHTGAIDAPFEDMLQFYTWALDSNDPITRDETWTIYCSGATADANVPITGTIPTDVNHPITFVGDLPTGHAYSTDYYHIVGPNEMLWTSDCNFPVFQNIQMQLTAEDDTGQGCLSITTPGAPATNLVTITNCIFRGDNIDDQDDIAVTATDPNTILFWNNNVVYDVNDGVDLLADCKIQFPDSRSGGGGSVFSGVVQ